MLIEALGGLVIGLFLGLLGSGGSILALPLLVYLLAHDPKVAVAESLAIVGAIALFGAVTAAVGRRVDWRSVVLFGTPAVAGTYLGAWIAQFVAGTVQLLLFAVVVLVASAFMFRRGGPETERAAEPSTGSRIRVVAEGLGVGILTGLVGVGGGFLVVPALVLLGGLPMRVAVGTSLCIIALKSGAGFAEYHGQMHAAGAGIAWRTIGIFVALGVVGSLLGGRIGGRLPQAQLRRIFAVFLVAIGVLMLLVEGGRLAGSGDGSGETTSPAAEEATGDVATVR